MTTIRMLLAAVLLASCGGPMVMPKAPELLKVEKMDGALMLTWKNNEMGCAKIEGQRMTATEPYKQVFSVAGDLTTTVDATATADTAYTYRLRCNKGGMDSEFCPEMNANPVK